MVALFCPLYFVLRKKKMANFKDLGVKNVGDEVDCWYPVHGSKNILQRMTGFAERWGVGKNGKYIVINCQKGYRCLSMKKVVILK